MPARGRARGGPERRGGGPAGPARQLALWLWACDGRRRRKRRPRRRKGTEAELGGRDNSEQLSSKSSTSTKSAKSWLRAPSASASKEALQAMILSLPRYHCENPASCKSPTLSTDTPAWCCTALASTSSTCKSGWGVGKGAPELTHERGLWEWTA